MDDELSDLIGLIYEAALEAELWPKVLARLADAAGAHVCTMGVYDLATDRSSLLAPRTDPEHLRLYGHWLTQAPVASISSRIVSTAANSPAGAVFDMRSVVPAEEFTRTAFYHEFWQPLGIGTAGLMGGALVDGSAPLGVGVHKPKPRHHDPFSPREIARFRTAMGHIARAVRLHRELRVRDFTADAVVTELDRQERGIVLLDEAAGVVFLNRAARHLLDESDSLHLQGGRLSAAADGDRLEALVASCADGAGTAAGPGGTLDLPRAGGRSPLRMLVAPLRMHGATANVPWLGLRGPMAIVTISDPDAEDDRCRDVLRRRFGLTPAEAAFALEIAKGDGRNAAGARRSISISTAHAHLNSIFEKTGTHRQAELVRIVLACRSDG